MDMKKTKRPAYFERVLDHVRFYLSDQLDPKLPEYFRGVLGYAESSATIDSEEIAEVLWNMSMHQQYIRTPLDDHTRGRIELWIQKAWNPTDEFLAGRIVGIAQMLDLPNALELLERSSQGELPQAVRLLIEKKRPLMDIKHADRLPDSLSEEDLRAYFREALEDAESSSESNPEEIAKALSELSIRQWHTYTLLDDDIRRRIESWIQKVWNPTSESLTGNIVGVVGMLGLPNSLQLLKQALQGELTPQVRPRIEEGIEHFGNTINDPYARMRRFEKKVS